jgi:hypothetical protein
MPNRVALTPAAISGEIIGIGGYDQTDRVSCNTVFFRVTTR